MRIILTSLIEILINIVILKEFMPKKIFYFFLCLTLTNACFSMQQPNHLKIVYVGALMNIDTLKKKAAEGDIVSALALHDFFKKIKNPLHQISGRSKQVLVDKALLNVDGDIDRTTREAIETYGQQLIA